MGVSIEHLPSRLANLLEKGAEIMSEPEVVDDCLLQQKGLYPWRQEGQGTPQKSLHTTDFKERFIVCGGEEG